MKKRIQRLIKKQGFTLVELIIVIAIIAILAVAAFMMLTKWLGKSRDSRRLGDIETASKSLQVWLVDMENTSGTLPRPDDEGEIVFDGSNVFTQGKYGEGVASNIDSIQKAPLNPQGEYYTYSRTIDGKKYQISTELEDGGEASAVLNNAFAVTRINAVRGNFEHGVYVFEGEVEGQYVAIYLPSITAAVEISGANIDITDDQPFVLDGMEFNLVESLDEISSIKAYKDVVGVDKPLAILWTGTESEIGTVDFVSKVTKNIDGMITQEVEKEDVVSMMLVGGVDDNTGGDLYADCALSGKIVEHGGNIDMYSEASILWNASYDCEDRKQNRVCDDGVLSGDVSYNFLSCVKGIPDNCEAKTHTYSSHSYNIGSFNHGDTTSSTVDVSENNGTFRYTWEGTCNDNAYINESESGPVLQGCNMNYSPSGNSCVADTKTVTCGGILPSNGSWNTSNTYTQTWNGTDWGSTKSAIYNVNSTTNDCRFKCDINYRRNGSSCVATCNEFKSDNYCVVYDTNDVDGDGIKEGCKESGLRDASGHCILKITAKGYYIAPGATNTYMKMPNAYGCADNGYGCSYCYTATWGGITNWQVPRRDYGLRYTYLNKSKLVDIVDTGWYWARENDILRTDGRKWKQRRFANGGAEDNRRFNPQYIRCVAGD